MPAPTTMSCRLTEGRELRGLSVAELAEQIGVTRQSIYKYENGTQAPSEETVERIQKALNLPASFFIYSSAIPDLSSRPIFFRDMKTNEEKNRKMSYRWLQILREQVERYENYLDFPPVHLPEIELPDILDLTDEDIDIAAENLRRAWGLGDGPIDNVTQLLENNGFIIFRKYLPAEKMDACSLVLNGRPYILINTYKQTCSRDLINLAHELGHVILHQNISNDVFLSKADFERIEKQAWRFAKSFLMPPAIFSAEVGCPTLNRFIALKKRWRVSISAMIMYCHDLELIDDARKQYFFREMTRMHIRKEEPLDSELPVEQSALLKDAEELLVDSQIFTRTKLFELSRLNIGDYCEMIGLPEDLFATKTVRPQLRIIQS